MIRQDIYVQSSKAIVGFFEPIELEKVFFTTWHSGTVCVFAINLKSVSNAQPISSTLT